MDEIIQKYEALVAQGWTPAVPLPVLPLPVPGTAGHQFSYVTTTGATVVILHSPSTGAYEVHGLILTRYLELGGPLGYGFPVSDELDNSVGTVVVGRVSHFERGSIFYSNGAVTEIAVGDGGGGADLEFFDGIDVSYAQGTIDWAKVVASSTIAFAWIKATEGDTITDIQFDRNWRESKGRVRRGAYHYFHARSTPDAARTQADRFVDVVAASGGGAELPLVADVESLPAGVTAAQAVSSLELFLSIVWQATGVRPIVYTYPSFWKDTMGGDATFSAAYPLWIASYGRALGGGAFDTRPNGPLVPPGWHGWMAWQHAVKPGVPGIGGLVDRDFVAVPLGETLESYLATHPV